MAWICTGTSPTSAFIASTALQGKPKTVNLLQICPHEYKNVTIEKLASLRYVPLDFDTIHVKVYTEGSLQNLPDKHSQIGLIFILADGDNSWNTCHWHSSRALRSPSSTEEGELFAFDFSLKRFFSQRQIMFQLLQKDVHTVLYIEKQYLCQNLMNITTSTIPDVMYRCREKINDEIVNRIWLIESIFNPADAMTKKNWNPTLLHIIRTNQHVVPTKLVFMLQHRLYHQNVFHLVKFQWRRI